MIGPGLLQTAPMAFLPLWAQIALFIVAAVCIIAQRRSSLALKEHQIVKEHCERLQNEVRALTGDNAHLRATRSLEPLLEAFQKWQMDFETWRQKERGEFEAWKQESRGHYAGAIARLEEVRQENTAAMNRLLERLERDKAA